MDPTNRVIWITPIVKASNNNNQYISIMTQGKAIQNPINVNYLYLYNFVIRYYTWPDGKSNPGITVGSDDWCFLKQDSTNLPNTNKGYTTTYYAPHSDISIPQ
jgi:hypothetical protein